METMGFLKGALLICKKMLGEKFEALSKEEKAAIIMKLLADVLKEHPDLMKDMAAAVQKELCA